MIDFFNINNIKKLIELSYFYIKNEKIRNEFIYYIKITSGYDMTFEEQVKEVIKKKKNHELNVYDENISSKSIFPIFCDHISINNLNPLDFPYNSNKEFTMGLSSDFINEIILKYIINNIKNIDGLHKLSINSNFYDGSVCIEEIILKGKTFIKNLIFDDKDPLCWVNYNLKNPKTLEKLNYDNIFLKMSWHDENENFSLFDFYKNNNTEFISLENDNYIFSYNVHMFSNLSSRINKLSNINNIIELIKYYKNNIKMIFLQEVELYNEDNTYFINKMKEIDFIFTCKSLNGSRTSYIYIFIKKNITNINYKIINTNIKSDTLSLIEKYIKKELNIKLWGKNKLMFPREQVLLNIKSVKICICHLNIGFSYDSKYKNEHKTYKKINCIIRTEQLKEILKESPHYIIGDFNFTIDDDEHLFLLKNNYILLNKNNDKSTPYNRVDHIYTSFKNENNDNFLLKTNYSDHLPLFVNCYNL